VKYLTSRAGRVLRRVFLLLSRPSSFESCLLPIVMAARGTSSTLYLLQWLASFVMGLVLWCIC